jgi:hypothetical protein
VIADVSNGIIRGPLTAHRPLPVYPPINGHSQSLSGCLKSANLRHRTAIRPNRVHQGSVLAIGLVLVAASGA